MNFAEALLRDSCVTQEQHDDLDRALGRDEDTRDRAAVVAAAGGELARG